MTNTLRPPPLMHANFRTSSASTAFLIPIKTTRHLNYPKHATSSPVSVTLRGIKTLPTRQPPLKHPKNRSHKKITSLNPETASKSQNEISEFSKNLVLVGAVTVGAALFVMTFDDQKALAFGPEGPLVEEFWDNMRRYALYALTVSTGVIYTVFQPILELLRNPISAILILTIIGGSIYIVSQVVSAMVGVSDFTYDYGY